MEENKKMEFTEEETLINFAVISSNFAQVRKLLSITATNLCTYLLKFYPDVICPTYPQGIYYHERVKNTVPMLFLNVLFKVVGKSEVLRVIKIIYITNKTEGEI